MTSSNYKTKYTVNDFFIREVSEKVQIIWEKFSQNHQLQVHSLSSNADIKFLTD